MAVQQAGGNADPRIHALSVAINLEELDPTPFLQYLKTQVEYYALDKGLDYPDLGGDEIWVHECLQLLKQSVTIEMFVLTRPSRRGIMNT